MRLNHSLIIVISILPGLFVTAGSVTTHAQQPANRNNERLLRQQVEATAVLSLESVSDEIREIQDMSVRISMTGEIVKLLTKRRPARCRQLLDSLFDDALQLRKTSAGIETAKRQDTSSLLQKIIRVAAAFDHELAQSYVEKYTRDDELANSDKSRARPSSEAAESNLQLATELVEKDMALAVSVAERSLASPLTPRVLIFLETLRKKDPQSANNFLLAAVQSVRARGAGDINELFLLYSYVFSPLRIPFVAPEGLSILQVSGYQNIAADHSLDPLLARRFLELSTEIMLDPTRYANLDLISAGVQGDLYFIRLTEPQAAVLAGGLVERLSAQENVLMGYLSPDQRASSQTGADSWNASQRAKGADQSGDQSSIEAILERAEKLSDPDQKDLLYYRAALKAVLEKKYKSALDIADKVSSKSNEAAKQFIAFGIAESEIKDQQLEEAEELAKRDGDLVRRAYIFNLVANSFVSRGKKYLGRAAEILNEVQQIALRLESKQERISTLIGSAAVCSRFDSVRSLELLGEAIETANRVESFAGDTQINRSLQIGDFHYFYPMYQTELTFAEIIRQQGGNDFNSTLAQLQNLKYRSPRFTAIIALCSLVLSG